VTVTLTLRDAVDLFYRTGEQDCGNMFDGDDVPSADDLREAWQHSHAADLEPDVAPYADAVRDAWVQGWRDAAAGYVAQEAAREEERDND
jgi:ribosome modulation factor